MIKKILSSQSNSITGAAVVLGLASFVSRLIGIVRDRLFAHHFGAGDVLDAYYAAFRIPDLVYNLIIVGALSAGFIPIFLKILNPDSHRGEGSFEEDKNGKTSTEETRKKLAWQVTNSVINILGIILILTCGLLFIFTPQLMKFVVPGFEADKMQMTITLTRIMFLSPILLGISGIASSVLQSFKNFLIYSLTPIMYNLGIIIGVIFFVPIWGINGLAYGVILGALLHLAIQIPSLYHHGFKYQALFLWKNKHVREIGKLMIPRTLGMAVSQINLLVITILASTLTAGSIAIFNLANNLQYFPIGLIGISFAIATFPTLAKFVAENNRQEMISQLSSTIRQILFFIIPITILFLLLRAQIVRVVLGSGEFDWSDTILTANTLAFFSFSLFAQCLIPLLARAFYALCDTWTPFFVGIVSTIVNVIAALYFRQILGISGLALGFSIAMIVQMSLLWLLLRKQLGTLYESKILISLYKISTASVVMAILIQALKIPLANLVNMTKFWGILTQGFVAGIVGLLVYLFICWFLKLEEMEHFLGSLKRRWLKLTNVQGEIDGADEI
ncbi:murein biosynthesis integral membrane protein MurJ [Patescibacteria group bacterium]|nr:murein biosynthesis integral membrane protein MurJ [Patescibacteria group bacterium]